MKEGLNRPPGYAGLMEMMTQAMAIDLNRHVATGTLAQSTIDRQSPRTPPPAPSRGRVSASCPMPTQHFRRISASTARYLRDSLS
ncbi:MULTISPECIES: hypothetical protein [Hyphobacterium]|uniref:Uncharacterized protein n=1 Tax=Hyphobacterium vulgare TaxID=1736751 RepID=A0ABV6ZXC4_9PROT